MSWTNLAIIQFYVIFKPVGTKDFYKPSCSGSHKQYKTLFKDHVLRFKIISRDNYREDGNLVPSPRCGFYFEAAFQL